ncbi:MAG: hypothetical protein HF314_07920 [Ignavibacteria bacterium]|jgi:uncharacterized membrane protein YphA (DoxX/SURF4 family)|nr:hypothetical protein [Ignavibacteria bacterium]MCU7517032.1 hypothetical protein [Ignavibacteria bacterium]
MDRVNKNTLAKIFRYILALIYLVSAVLKLIDFEATAVMIKEIVQLDLLYVRTALLILILLEASVATALVLDLMKRFTRALLFALSGFFIIFNIALILNGFDNCGCYGASIKQSPNLSLIKNILIVLMTFMI